MTFFSLIFIMTRFNLKNNDRVKFTLKNMAIMVLILDGNSEEVGAGVWSDLGYAICLRHFRTVYKPVTWRKRLLHK